MMMINDQYFLGNIRRSSANHERFQWMRVYARWLDDHGDDRASAWRWIAANQKVPQRRFWGRWDWSDSRQELWPQSHPRSILAKTLAKPFATRIKAEKALAEQVYHSLGLGKKKTAVVPSKSPVDATL